MDVPGDMPISGLSMSDASDHAKADMIRGSLWTLISALSGIPIGFASNLVVARFLGPANFGTLATLAAVVSVASTILNLGVSQATVQWIAESRDQPIQPQRLPLLRNCVGYHSIIEGPVLAVIVFLLLRAASPWEWVLGLLAALASQVLGTSSVILTATARNAAAAKLSIVASLMVQAATICAAVVTGSAYAVYALQLAAGVLGPALCFVTLESRDRRAFVRPLLFKGLPPGFLSYGLSACGASLVASLVFGRSEVFVLKLDGFAVATGVFTLATGLAGQITVPMDSVMGPLLPTAAGILAQAPDRTANTASRSLRVTAILGALTMATALPGTYFLLPSLFGSAYDQARVPFLLLGLVSCFQSVTVPMSTLVMATRNAPSVLRVNVVCVLVDAVVAFALIPAWGLWGAVAANALAQLTSLGLLSAVLVRRLDLPFSDLVRAIQPATLGVVAAVISVAVLGYLTVPVVAAAVTAPLLGVAVVSGGLRLRSAWRLRTSDSNLIEGGLPAALRGAYRVIAGALCIVADPPSQPLVGES